MNHPKSKSSFGKKIVYFMGILLLGIIIFSGVQVFRISSAYRKADRVQESLMIYKPTQQQIAVDMNREEAEILQNTSLMDLQNIYPDVVGWLTINDTNIDYPFVQGRDNDQYLRSTLDGKYLVSGTVFLDYQAEKDFSNFNSVLYGHLMNNGTMFSDIEKFHSKAYFENHLIGELFLTNQSYKLETLAYMVVDSSNPIIYNPFISAEVFLPYVKENAIQYQDMEISETDRFITLSTCNSNSDNDRSILILKLTEI